jgi:hypothetical protein
MLRARLTLHAITVAAAFLLAACGGSSPPAPSPQPPPAQQAPTVAAVTPVSGLTSGGTTITITGTNFAAGATVTVGGAAATGVAVQSPLIITAATPAHAAGATDVVVSVNGMSASLANGFTFTAPTPANAPPLITGMTAQSRRRGAPAGFADLEDLVDVSATTQDAETSPEQLTYEWSASIGTIEGEGRAVRWRAPDRASTPTTASLRVQVVEKFDGGENRVTGTLVIDLHDSEKEIADLGYQFLVEFSEQKLAPETIVRNFTDSCRGKFDELDQVRDHQRRHQILEWSVDNRAQVVIGFGATCPYYAPERIRPGDGCAWFPVRWKSSDRDEGGKIVETRGFDQVNAIFERGQWRLCDSDYKASTTTANGVPSARPYRK